MVRTFKAVLNGNELQWLDEAPELGDRSIEVSVTILDEEITLQDSDRRKKMAEVLEKLAASNPFAGVDPLEWQRDIRQERSRSTQIVNGDI